MSDLGEVALLAVALACMTALICIADRLCEMEPRVTVQLLPTAEPESRGDKAATAGSE